MCAVVQAVMYQGMLDAGFDAAEAQAWTSSLVPHHQWMIVSVEHALMLVALRDKILQVPIAAYCQHKSLYVLRAGASVCFAASCY
jgi:hypothetical protein